MKFVRCQWIPAEGKPGYWICPLCEIPHGGPRWRAKPSDTPPNVYRSCRGKRELQTERPDELLSSPTAVQKVKNWATATAAWIAAGCPVRSAEEQHVLAEICHGCKHYKPDPVLPLLQGGQCGVCGCGIEPERKLMNALSYATYRCKKGFWDESGVTFVNPPQYSDELAAKVEQHQNEQSKVD